MLLSIAQFLLSPSVLLSGGWFSTVKSTHTTVLVVVMLQDLLTQGTHTGHKFTLNNGDYGGDNVCYCVRDCHGEKRLKTNKTNRRVRNFPSVYG